MSKYPPRARRADAGRAAKGRRISGAGNLPEAVGILFRSARELQGLSQDQVAGLVSSRLPGLSRTTISDIERGKSLPSLPTLVSLSKILHIDPQEVLERVDLEVTVPVDDTGMDARELLARAQQLYWAGDYRAALAVFGATLERLALAPPDDDDEMRRLQAKIEIDRAATFRECSALRAAEASVKRAIEYAKGLPTLQSEAYMVLASLHSHEELLELAELHADKSISLAEHGDARLQGKAWNQKGNVLFRAARYEEARAAFLQSRKFAIERNDLNDLVSVEGNLGACLMMMDRLDQARARFVTAVETARKASNPAAEAFWLVELGRLAHREGQLDDADRYAVLALGIARPAARVLTIFRAEWLRHLVAKSRDPEEPDAKRLAALRKLYPRVREHAALEVIQEFQGQVLGGSDA